MFEHLNQGALSLFMDTLESERSCTMIEFKQ